MGFSIDSIKNVSSGSTKKFLGLLPGGLRSGIKLVSFMNIEIHLSNIDIFLNVKRPVLQIYHFIIINDFGSRYAHKQCYF